ncbi:MAG: subfamily B ATP-binding cassette protein MsbA [Alphaproteobacteria bacterium]
MVHTKNQSAYQLLWRLMRDELPRHKVKLSIAIICMVIAATMTAATAYLIDPAIKEIFIKKNTDLLYTLPAIIIAVSFLRGLSTYGQAYLMGGIGTKIVNNLQIKMLQKILYCDLDYFTKNHSGEIVSQFINDANHMRDTATTVIVAGIKDTLTLIGCASVMFYQDAVLAGLTLFIFLPAIVVIKRLMKKTMKSAFQIFHKTGNVSSALAETIRGIRIVRVYNQENYELNRIRSIFKDRLYYLLKELRARSASSPITEAITGIGIAVAILYAGMRGIDGDMEINNFMAFFTSMMMAYQPGRALSGLATKMQSGIVAASRVYDILDMPYHIKAPEKPVIFKKCSGNISFENMSFAYSSQTPILKNINLEIQSGQKIALVGPSGGGKSTLLNLIPRFYEVSSGSIRIDNVDIRNIDPHELRQHISLVSQDAFLFYGTIKENIMYGNSNASTEQFINAMKNAAAFDFIQELPNKEHTYVGESGVLLSGGQKQRIAIARAFLKDAPIILLDEATSALDSHSESYILEALERLTHGKTSITIAHRLSTIMNADQIIVIDNQKIIEQGSHDFLLQQKGLYARLHQQQTYKKQL